MQGTMRDDALRIVARTLAAVQPDDAVRRVLAGRSFPGRVVLLAVGKAAQRMAEAAYEALDGRVERGVVVTKYGHEGRVIGPLVCVEAGHPEPDENSLRAARLALDAVAGLTERDTVLLLLSGGGSALFELPHLPLDELRGVNAQLLACGADIVEINTVRKRLSAVKGGKFALACAPARVVTLALNDVLDGAPDAIASGPACPDPTTCADAERVAEKYRLRLSGRARELLRRETPKTLDNAEIRVIGGVGELCAAAAEACRELGYEPTLLTARLCCEAREAGAFLADAARSHARDGRARAFLAGGETVVRLRGHGRGGRNQELALAAAKGIAGLANALIFSLGSDGTDGPTDAAGGIVDGDTAALLAARGVDIDAALADNDSYHALEAADGLLRTGPTGTNVNDVSVLLLRP